MVTHMVEQKHGKDFKEIKEIKEFKESEKFVVYIYDIKASDFKEFNKIKRRFYYKLNKIKS